MDDTKGVHATPERVPRGIRMDRDLWAFVDRLAGEGSASRLIEDWVREKRDGCDKAA